MMIGPSAPNGPPVPMEMADEIGFRTATFGSIRLLPKSIASRASGMPWPRICSEPNRAMRPMMIPPRAGTSMTTHPRWFSAGEWNSPETVWKNAMFVIRLMSQTSAAATKALMIPMTTAIRERTRTRLSCVKSASRSADPLFMRLCPCEKITERQHDHHEEPEQSGARGGARDPVGRLHVHEEEYDEKAFTAAIASATTTLNGPMSSECQSHRQRKEEEQCPRDAEIRGDGIRAAHLCTCIR